MPPRRNKEEPRGLFKALAEWPKVVTALATAFLLFLIPTAFKPVRDWLWPADAPGYPIVCTAEPVWRGGTERLVEIYLVNTTSEELTGEQLTAKLRAALGDRAAGASTAVLFPYQVGEPKARSAEEDARFNEGKGELTVRVVDRGVIVQPKKMAALAILRANVLFPVDDDSIEFSRGAKGTAGMFDLTGPTGPEAHCFTGP